MGIVLTFALGAGTASADPPGTTNNDEGNARTFCQDVGYNPTPSGLMAAGNNLSNQLSVDDTADGVAYGILYVCPEYKALFTRAMNIYGR